MKKKILTRLLVIPAAVFALGSCLRTIGSGDVRERNIENAMLSYLDSVPGVEYIGLSDTHTSGNGNFQAVIIYKIPDRSGNKVERNARVITNGDGTEIYSWEDLDCQILDEVKQTLSDKFEEKGICIDGGVIDALIELKRR